MGSHREFLCFAQKLHFKMFLKHFQNVLYFISVQFLIGLDWLSFRFLDILAARKDPAGLIGEVLIDGAPQPPNFKCLSGYVVQVSETGNERRTI